MHFGVVFLIIAAVISGSQSIHNRTKRMYGMCPPNFYRIGSACYFISTDKLNWLDAHFECRDKNSKLAEPAKVTDRQLKKYLIAGDKNRDDIWIGGTYEWNKRKWEWGYSGNELQYDSFSQMDPGSSKDLHYHCAVLNPQINYRWSARPCADTHRFICQHKMPKVSANNRQQVYQRWNETFPNQKANEVILKVIDGEPMPRKHRRRKIAADNNETMPGDSPNVVQSKKSPTDVAAATTRHSITRPGQKRSQWPVLVNSQNNETIEKPARRRTAFDRTVERKRQKEMKRRRRMQQKRKQKAIEAENKRKAKESAKIRTNDAQNFPPPITEILMFPEITPEVFATKSAPKFDEAPKPTTTERTTTTTTTTITTTEPPVQPRDEIKPIGEKRFFDNEARPNRFEQKSPSESTDKYDEYIKKLENRSKEQQKRIEEEERKREELKKSREAEIERLKKLYDEQKAEEERLAADVKQREEEQQKIQLEEERIKMEKAKKEAEEEQRTLAKQAARIEALRRVKEKIRKDKEEKLRLALAEQSKETNNSASDNETDRIGSAEPTDRQVTEEEKKMRLQKLRERLEKLTPEQRKKFHEMRMQRKKQKLKRSHATSERSIIIP